MDEPKCECGCGEQVRLIERNDARNGWIKGQPYRFKWGHHIKRAIKGYRYKKAVNVLGQTVVQREHRFRAEAALGKPLPRRAHVHHVDGTKSMTSALVICEHSGYHKLLHIRARVKAAGGNPNTDRICTTCKTVKPIEAFVKNSKTYCGVLATCKQCFNVAHVAASRRRRARQADGKS